MNATWSKKTLLVILVAACFGLILGYELRDNGPEDRVMSTKALPLAALTANATLAHQHSDHGQPEIGHLHEATADQEPPTGTVYICPMNCVKPMSKPGKCPVCGMDLIASDAGELQHGNLPPRITLAEEAVRAVDIQVAPVEQKYLTADIRLYGKIEYDPVEQYKVTSYAPGVIDNIYVRRAGQVVRVGDPLFDLNSAELYYLEQELFTVLEKLPYDLNLRPGKYHSRKRVGRWARLLLPPKEGSENSHLSTVDNKAIQKELDQIKRKMRLLGLSDQDVDGLIVKGRPTGIATVTTPMTGVVIEQNAFRGQFINTGDVVFTVANPRVLWARLDAYASDFPWIRLGQEAEFTTDAYPGQSFKGKVLFLDPEFDEKRRAFKVGVLYRDDRGLLKPNMLVQCSIHATLTSGGRGTTEIVTQGMAGTAQTKRTGEAPLVIPETAPLITGKRAVVYVKEKDTAGTYVGREITLGPRADGYYIVNAGLHKGEMVVVNGNFKIDSAIQIMAGPSMMSYAGSEMPLNHYDHVQTPPLPNELQGERSERGAKFKNFPGHDMQPSKPHDTDHSTHGAHPSM